MKLSDAEQEGLVSLLTRLYQDLVEMETRFRLIIGDGDFRPRIDYFHDAVRAFTGGSHQEREEGGRLSVEYLAYDLACLRFLAAMPLSPFKPHAANLSAKTDMIDLGARTAPATIRPDRVEKERLVELYQRYGVLFSALLKPLADNDFHDRADGLNQDVRDINAITQQCEKGEVNEQQLANIIENLNDNALRGELMDMLRKKKFRQRTELEKITKQLKDIRKKKDKDIAAVEAAHMG